MSKHYPLLVFCTFFSLFVTHSQIFAQATGENCTNGIDDDGDGLIDCYDDECTCTGACDDFYYTTCNADCYYIPPCTQLTLGIQWQATAETGTYSPIVAGDMDKDGIPDLVTYWVEHDQIYIIDGATGATKVTITNPCNLPGGTAPAIADLDHDGFGELVIIGDDRYLRCYNHDGTLQFTSTVQVGYDQRYRFSVPNIADFDHNGWAEVNVGNQVYNGQTGALLASGGATVSAGEHPARVALGFSFNQPVAIDALPDSFCPDCDGLEIVAGNQVLAVNLTTGAVTPVVAAPSNYSDGFTSVVDFDQDGDLDAIVQGKRGNLNYIYCWEIETPAVIREYKLINNYNQGASRANVADLNGDGQLEVSFVGYPRLYALRNNFTLMWTRTTNDFSSVTTSSVFDFCGDGSADVIYRGETFLQVLEGATGAVKWQDNCLSATHIEAPLVLDVDADGQTEIVIQCGTNGTPDVGTVFCYEAVGQPGISSRRVWNQHAYFNTNINDDLSVPRYQQNPHLVGNGLVLNTFMNQYFNPTFPSPDGELSLTNVSCEGDSMAITAELCNKGDNLLLPVMPISFYRGNPQSPGAVWIGTVPVGIQLDPDSCRTLTMKVPRQLAVNDTIYLVLNDDHSKPVPYNVSQDFPVTTYGECTFTNNLSKFYYKYTPDLLQIGPDTLICDNATVLMNASGDEFVTWAWQDGVAQPFYLAPDGGTYSVTITDVCGITQTDTRIVSIDSSTVVQLGPDHFICRGETVSLSEDGFDYYNWKPSGFVDCFTCPSVNSTPVQSVKLILEAGFNNGCRSTDTVEITVYDTYDITIDTTICYGRTVSWNGFDIEPDAEKTLTFQSVHGCDSTVQVRVTGTFLGTYQVFVDTSVCQNRTLPYNNVMLNPGEQKIFRLNAITGCDSTVLVNVAPLDTFATFELGVICFGDTYSVFGQPLNASGTYKMVFTAKNGCDSTHTVNLTVLPEIAVSFEGVKTCINEPSGALTALTTGGAPPYDYTWSLAGSANASVLDNLWAGDYNLTVTDDNNCTQIATGTVESYPAMQYELSVDSVRCYGENNGQIAITTTDQTLMFAIDDQPFVQGDAFGGLVAGDYTVYALDTWGCTDTTDLSVGQPPQLLLVLPADTTILLGDSVRIAVQTNSQNIIRLSWANTSYLTRTDTMLTYSRPLASVRYGLTITDERGCTASDEVTITVERIRQVFVPNVFSFDATQDINRRLEPGFGNSVQRIKRFSVFDRWGDLVHQVQNAAPGASELNWDGKTRGKSVLPGAYIWTMEVELVDGTTEWYRGDVSVVY